MNIPTMQEQKVLPKLIKKSTTFKMIVPLNVEEKIRYLCRKFPTLEWSGILFTSHEGSFEEGNLTITCRDLYPMDLGSATFTDFKMDETVAGYIAENFDLFGCDLNLIHSHNQMDTFFSGTDTSTLQSEGNDQNCFVSLIVNNKGTYCAAITRKIRRKAEIITKSLETSYQFFGEGEIKSGGATPENKRIIDEEVIEYFMLDITVEHATNFEALDNRFNEIEKKKAAAAPKQKSLFPVNYEEDYGDTSFNEWRNYKHNDWEDYKHISKPEDKEPDDEPSSWVYDAEKIHQALYDLITCSLDTSVDVDLDWWVSECMEDTHNQIFGSPDSTGFLSWRDFIVEFVTDQYDEFDYDGYNHLEIVSSVARHLYDELDKYPTNEYLESYKERLKDYYYE